MSASPLAERDERTVAVENAGYRRAYLFLSFGLLALVAYRSFARGEQPWDLILLVVLGGAVGSAYQAYHRVVSRSWVVNAAVAAAAAAALAAAMVWLRR